MTGKSHSILDAVKHAVFEDEPEAPHQPAAASPTHTAPAAPAAHTVAPVVSFETPAIESTPIENTKIRPIESGTVPDDNEVYKRLLAKTDFESTDIATTIHKFLDPLKVIADAVMPPNVKFKTAVLQASAQAGLTEAGILSAFDHLRAQLEQEQNAFDEKARQFADREIANRQERIAEITNQISQLQQELSNLSGELVEAQGKATHAQTQFTAAAQRRAIEIEQQKAQYASLLKG